eukprot:3507670-Rhodomonas_salina.1
MPLADLFIFTSSSLVPEWSAGIPQTAVIDQLSTSGGKEGLSSGSFELTPSHPKEHVLQACMNGTVVMRFYVVSQYVLCAFACLTLLETASNPPFKYDAAKGRNDFDRIGIPQQVMVLPCVLRGGALMQADAASPGGGQSREDAEEGTRSRQAAEAGGWVGNFLSSIGSLFGAPNRKKRAGEWDWKEAVEASKRQRQAGREESRRNSRKDPENQEMAEDEAMLSPDQVLVVPFSSRLPHETETSEYPDSITILRHGSRPTQMMARKLRVMRSALGPLDGFGSGPRDLPTLALFYVRD